MRWFHWICYVLFGLCLFIFFTYLNFPYQRVKAIMVTEFQSNVSAQLRIEKLKADPLLGLVGRNVAITAALNGEPVELLKSNKVRLRFMPLSWLRGQAPIRLEIQAYGGSIHTAISVSQLLNSGQGPIDIHLRGIRPGRNTALRSAIAQDVTGTLEGDLKLQTRPGELKKSQMGGRLLLSDIMVNGLRNVSPDPGRLTFSKIECVVAFSDGILHVAPLRVQGREVDGILEGTLNLQPDLKASVLNMNGRVLFKPVLAPRLGLIMNLLSKARNAAGEVPFTLTGTLNKPSLKVAGMSF